MSFGSAAVATESRATMLYSATMSLGDGVRLFDWPGGRSVRLEHISVEESPTATALWTRVVR
jgi:hypothetical protein